jgi:hypothetical protein
MLNSLGKILIAEASANFTDALILLVIRFVAGQQETPVPGHTAYEEDA